VGKGDEIKRVSEMKKAARIVGCSVPETIAALHYARCLQRALFASPRVPPMNFSAYE
jgi:hypothetical protein